MTILYTLLIIVMIATAGVLFAGIFVFYRGGDLNARYGNKLMRARVALQFIAVALVVIILAGS